MFISETYGLFEFFWKNLEAKTIFSTQAQFFSSFFSKLRAQTQCEIWKIIWPFRESLRVQKCIFIGYFPGFLTEAEISLRANKLSVTNLRWSCFFQKVRAKWKQELGKLLFRCKKRDPIEYRFTLRAFIRCSKLASFSNFLPSAT